MSTMVDIGCGSRRSCPQSSSASCFTAGAFGLLLLIQSPVRPERYGESRLLEMPSSPSRQALNVLALVNANAGVGGAISFDAG